MDSRPPTLGVDIGGVIIDRIAEGTDTSFFGKHYKRTPAVTGAFEALARLNAGRFAGRVHLVSKCGETVEGKTRSWLKANGFHEQTGVTIDHLHFCRARPQKADICAALGITHFVDDRLEVLGYLSTVPHRYLFRPDESELAAHREHLRLVTRADAWPDLECLL